jgi:hypothetical protein
MSKLRTTLVALSAAGLMSAAGATNAVAAPMTGRDDLRPAADLGSAQPVVMQVDAFPTGDGPADEQVCDLFALRINQILSDMSDAIDEGDGDRAVENHEAVENVESMAMDAGCAIIH